MSKIIVYKYINFQGLSKEFTSSVANLVNQGFNDCISSLKVMEDPWVAYSGINFSGKQFVFEEGDYANVECNDTFSSLEHLQEDLSNPQIMLYEHDNYKGRSVVFTSETNLVYGSFNDMASSYKVQRWVWVLYEHIDRGGTQTVARVSHDMPSYDCFNDRVSHLRPLRSGKPAIKSEVVCDKKEEHVKSVQVDSICGLNCGENEQSFTTEISKEYEGSVTYSFSFSNTTQITWGTSFSVDVEMVKAEQIFSLSNTFTVEKGTSNTRTEKSHLQFSLPIKIPPRTKLTVNMVRKEVDVRVPVKLTVTSASHSAAEYGEYRCQSGNSISTEYREEKI